MMPTFDVPWKTLIDAAPDGLCVLDADGYVRYANAAATTLLALPSPENVPVAEWLTGLGERNRDLLLKTIEDKGQIRVHLPANEHEHLLFEVERSPDLNGTLCRIRRDFDVEASDVIAITVHELRIAMTSIMGYAKMLLTVGSESLTDMQRQFLDTIDRNVKRLNDDLSAVQDMTRIDRGKVQLDPTPQSPANVAALVLAELQPLVEEKRHHVALDFPDDLPPLHADGERLEQILRTLLDNALKYTPTIGQITVLGRAVGNVVQIDVADNGPGIPVAEQEKVFSKFFRGEDERIRKYPGLGINLYVARGLTQLQGGQLWFESSPGHGSTFSFSLPVHQN